MYPLQNPCASKSDSHGFASKSDTHHRKKHLRKQVLFSVIFALRRVLLLRSYIRLAPSGIRFASLEGEYNITEAVRLQYHCRLRQYHADEVGISLKTPPQSQNCGQIRTATHLPKPFKNPSHSKIIYKAIDATAFWTDLNYHID